MFIHPQPWSQDHPQILVVACSDGRLEQQLDDFLSKELGISCYDRFYVPGGPGALASSGFEFLRVDQCRRECRFLVEAHAIREVILIFHSNGPDGPDEAMCADYARKFPARSTEQLRAQQETDMHEVTSMVFNWPPGLLIRVYRAEVGMNNEVKFVALLRR